MYGILKKVKSSDFILTDNNITHTKTRRYTHTCKNKLKQHSNFYTQYALFYLLHVVCVQLFKFMSYVYILSSTTIVTSSSLSIYFVSIPLRNNVVHYMYCRSIQNKLYSNSSTSLIPASLPSVLSSDTSVLVLGLTVTSVISNS